MSLFNYAFWTSWLFLRIVPSAWSALYVVNPQASTPCQAGRKCLVEWLDDGRVPLLTSMGASTVGLYHDDQRLVQQITPVDVSAVHSLEFTPDARAGPNYDRYYVSFQSTVLQVNGTLYTAFSPLFPITGMSGAFANPVPSLTAPLAVPPSVASHAPNEISSTITVGTLFTTTTPATAPPPPTTTPAATRSAGTPTRVSSATMLLLLSGFAMSVYYSTF